MTNVQTTSLFALDEIRRSSRPTLGERQRAVLDELRKQANMTNSEIAASLHVPINTITPRTHELVKMKKVVEACRRECRVTGRTCIAWKIKSSTTTPYEN